MRKLRDLLDQCSARLTARGLVPQRCTRPPEGWWCSREAGHEGPCAARPTARQSKPGYEGSYWCCAADFGKHEKDCPNYTEESDAT